MNTVYLVGAGPGDPDLLTVKAHRLLAAADAVLYDRLVTPEILACVKPGAELHYVGKGEGEQESTQRRILGLLALCARRHRTVVRLKGGDPMVFGRGAEEWLWLAERGIPVEIVPGISSAIAAPSLHGIPLTLRGVARSFAVITGQSEGGMTENWEAYARVDTLVILMGVKHRERIAAALIAAGRPPDQPVAFVERASTPRQRCVESTLAAVARGEAQVESPAVFVAGDVVAHGVEALQRVVLADLRVA